MADATPDDKTLLANGSSTIEPPRIPEYELLRCIGSGSYGEVWLARSVTGMYRAIKVVHRRKFEQSRPFDREFSGMQKFEPISRSHPGLVNILHVGLNQDTGFFYYVMELADDYSMGQEIDPKYYVQKTLTEISKRSRMPFEECLQVGLSLTGALGQLHKNKLIHRDIKPSNIIFVHGVPKLADIGLVAALDETRSFVGTEGFVPREGPGTPQADLFALGKVLYEIATGKDRLDFPELPADVNELPDHKRILELNEIILKACDQNHRRRYQSAAEMEADLQALQQGRSLRRAATLRRQLAWGALLALVVVAVGTFALWKSRADAIGTAVPKVPLASLGVQPSASLPWQRTTDFPFAGYEFQPVEDRGAIYLITGSKKHSGDTCFSSTANTDGSLQPWKKIRMLPEEADALGIAVWGDWIYAAPESGNIYRAKIEADGNLGEWLQEKPAAERHGGRLALHAYRDHLYIIGGFHYRPFENVYSASIAVDGSLGDWKETTPLPKPMQHATVDFFADRVYLAGGITTDNVILNSCYSAPVRADGAFGEWRAERDLPTPLWVHSSFMLDDMLILVGGESGYTTGASYSVLWTHIQKQDGHLEPWKVLGELPHSFPLGVGVVHEPKSGRIYLVGGSKGYRSEMTANTWQISAAAVKEAIERSLVTARNTR